MKITITYSLLLSCFFLLLSSCSQEQPAIVKAPKLELNKTVTTRAVKKKVAAEAYYYRTLASYVNGAQTNPMAHLMNDKQVNLVVLYEAAAPWAELLEANLPQATGNDNLNELLRSYQLQIVKQFSIDQNNKGLVLESTESLSDPVETARRLSLVEHVLMVNIKEIPVFEAYSVQKENK